MVNTAQSMASPLISVIIATYNRASFLREAVDSVLCQTFPDFELIVVDDGSQDNTREVLVSYGSLIRTLFQANAGLSAARNRGINAARGEWIAFLDSDDVWLPEKLATQMADLATRKNVCLHTTNATIYRDHIGRETDLFEYTGASAVLSQPCSVIARAFVPHLKYGLAWAQCLLVRRQSLLAAGLFESRYKLWMDLDLWARVGLEGPWGVNKRPLVKILRRQEQTENISSIRTRDSLYAHSELVECYEKLLRNDKLMPEEKNWLKRILSGARGTLALDLWRSGRPGEARQQLRSAVREAPSLRSWTKYSASFVPGMLSLWTAWRRMKTRTS